MVNKWAFEAPDRTLRDIMHFNIENSNEKAFGGKVIVLGSNLGKFCWLFQIQIDLKLYWQ